MYDKLKPLAGLRFGMLGKGGSGKSTTMVLLAAALRRSGYEVCVLDADSTNVGVHRALGIDAPPRALIDYFGGMIFSGGAVTCPVDDPTPLPASALDLERLPGEYWRRNAEGIVLLTAGKIGDKGPGAGCDGPISKIARDVRVRAGAASPVTLVDFKAGFEDSARGVVNGLDWAIVVVDPTNAAIQLAVDLKRMVEQTRAGVPPATHHLESRGLVEMARRLFREARVKGVLVVMNRVRDEQMRARLSERLERSGIRPVGAFPEDPEITLAWLAGDDLTRAHQEEAERVVAALEEAARQAAAGRTSLKPEPRGALPLSVAEPEEHRAHAEADQQVHRLDAEELAT